VHQYLKLSHYAPKQSHYVLLCSMYLATIMLQNYAGIIHQGLALHTGTSETRYTYCLH